MISVIIATSEADLPAARALASKLKGAGEVLVETGGSSAAEGRNIGAGRAVGDELLFLDSDVSLPEGLDLSGLRGYGFDMATCYFAPGEDSAPFDPLVMLYQNWTAQLGLPGGYFGGYMYMKRWVFDQVGGFRDVPMEDIEFAQRAWLLGVQIGLHDFVAVHQRPYHWRNAVGALVTKEGLVWGWP